MNETPEQYTARILSNVGTADPLDVLAQTPARLRRAVEGRPVPQLMRKPQPERWSVGEILAHLADAEIVGAWRLRSILASNGVDLQAYDQNRWAAAGRYDAVDPFESLDLFDVLRVANLRLLRRVDSSLLENYGMHAERGRESVTHIVRLYAGHDLNHVKQVEQILA